MTALEELGDIFIDGVSYADLAVRLDHEEWQCGTATFLGHGDPLSGGGAKLMEIDC